MEDVESRTPAPGEVEGIFLAAVVFGNANKFNIICYFCPLFTSTASVVELDREGGGKGEEGGRGEGGVREG